MAVCYCTNNQQGRRACFVNEKHHDNPLGFRPRQLSRERTHHMPPKQKKTAHVCFEQRPHNHLSHTGNVPVTFRKAGEASLPFRPLAQRVEITGSGPVKEAVIEYEGSVQFDPAQRKNWNNIITEDIVSMNWYSIWYPQELSVRLSHGKIIVLHGQHWVG